MRIAKLTVSIGSSGIAYNSSQELKTDKARGSVLEDGKVVRGLGTHFASKEAQERYDKLIARSNEIRGEFARKFGRFILPSTFVVNKAGDAAKFAEQYSNERPDIIVDVSELNTDGELGERELQEWASSLKDQLKRTPLGRGKDVADEGIQTLKALLECPVIAESTRTSLQNFILQAEAGKMTRVDLKRNISLLKVEVDQTPLMAQRSAPALSPATKS